MTCFADYAVSVVTPIISNDLIAKDTRCLRIRVPEMARQVTPGQFFMVRNPGGNDPLIGRAFALYDVDPELGELELVYVVKGKLTSSIAPLGAGDSIAVWGPLGNGFPAIPVQHLVMVAGGIGQTPFLSLAKAALGRQAFGQQPTAPTENGWQPALGAGWAERVSLCYGVRTADYLAGVDQFRAAGVEVHLATEDGSIGPAQRVNKVLEQLLDRAEPGESLRIVCCGPEPMMEAIAEIARARSIACQVSLETPMACGIGICFTCVAKVGAPDDWDYKRTCVEGPVFDASTILWH